MLVDATDTLMVWAVTSGCRLVSQMPKYPTAWKERHGTWKRLKVTSGQASVDTPPSPSCLRVHLP